MIDEVDVFFSKRFYGGLFNAGVTLRSSNISALVTEVWKNKNLEFDVQACPELKTVLNDFNREMEQLLRAMADVLRRNSQKEPKDYLWSTDTKTIGYKLPGGDDIQYGVVKPNETMFLYLHMASQNAIDTETVNEKHLGIDINFGKFSYAKVPQDPCYSAIVGVTGTLKTQPRPETEGKMILTHEEMEILKNDFFINTMTFIPSVFGKTSTLCYNLSDDFKLHQGESSWMAGICGAAERQKSQGGVLIFFKNKRQLKHFRTMKNGSQTIDDALVLMEDTPAENRADIVSAATQKGKVTLLTRSFGRGVDFVTYGKKGDASASSVTVIQTFFSSAQSEEVQIKGRTARQGFTGKYMVHIEVEQFVSKFGPLTAAKDPPDQQGIKEVELQPLREKNKQKDIAELFSMQEAGHKQFEKYLSERRSAKGMEKEKARQERKKNADLCNTISENLLRKLDLGSDVSDKVKAITEACVAKLHMPVHYIIMLDNSWSMVPRWANLFAAFEKYKKAAQEADVRKCDEITLIWFAETASIKPTIPLRDVTAIPKKRDDQGVGDGTSFAAPINSCAEVLGTPRPPRKTRLVFLTDGSAYYPDDALRDLTDKYASVIDAYFSIAISIPSPPDQPDYGTADTMILDKIGEHMKKCHIPTTCMSAKDQVELQKAFCACVEDGGVMHSM